MGNYAAYLAYKTSEVEWLGEIPAHWEVLPIKFALALPITDGPHETPTLYDEGIPFISAEAIKNDRIDFERKRGYISQEEHLRFSKKYKPQYGDVYMVKSGATTGNVARVTTKEEFSIWSPLAALRPDRSLATTDFIFYAMKSNTFTHSVTLSWSFGTQQNIGMGVISNIRIALPPLPEQEAIARFLDNKTAQIDGLIAKKEALLARLADKRTALISQAVTKGLDPRVPMRDSGVEWLGEIPSHWVTNRLKWSVTQCKNGVWGDEPDGENDLVCLRVADFDRQSFTVGTDKLTMRGITPKDRRDRLLSKGDLLLEKSGGGEQQLVGTVVYFDHEFEAVTSNFVARMPPVETVNGRFLSYVHAHLYSGHVNYRSIKQTTGIQNLDSQQYLNEVIAYPPLYEQEAIAHFLDKQTEMYYHQTAKIQAAIGKLKEYRTALITGAVTGKIDVRGVV